jgi:hypothetical protein
LPQVTRFLLCIRAAFCAVAALPALAKEPAPPPEYPPGLFENSPVVGAQPAAPAGQPDADPAVQDDCADIASRVFHSLAEVKAAHARCDERPDPGEPD